MNKKLAFGLVSVVAVLVAAAVYFLMQPPVWREPGTGTGDAAKFDARNAVYAIEGKVAVFKNGESYVQFDDSKLVRYRVLNQADGLLDEDQLTDAGVLLATDADGVTTYYAAGILSGEGDWKGTNAILLGTGIGIETIDVDRDRFIVNYFERASADAKTAVVRTKEYQARLGVFVELTTTPTPAPSRTP